LPTPKAQRAAEILAAARRGGTLLPDLPPELRPATLEEAYETQYAIAGIFGPIGGWKVGVPKANEEPRATPIPRVFVLPSGASWPATKPTRIEVEVALKMGSALAPRGSPYRSPEVLGAIASAHLAFELLGARFEDRKQVAGLTLLADGQSNGGLVVGGEISDWAKRDLARFEIALLVDGAIDGTTDTGNSFEATLEALTWLANHAAEHVGGLLAGQIILTGARIGPLAVPATCQIEARAADATVRARLG
jgi:2-keto-4-pentenoate hydratase